MAGDLPGAADMTAVLEARGLVRIFPGRRPCTRCAASI